LNFIAYFTVILIILEILDSLIEREFINYPPLSLMERKPDGEAIPIFGKQYKGK
jgi:hypothetical protein